MAEFLPPLPSTSRGKLGMTTAVVVLNVQQQEQIAFLLRLGSSPCLLLLKSGSELAHPPALLLPQVLRRATQHMDLPLRRYHSRLLLQHHAGEGQEIADPADGRAVRELGRGDMGRVPAAVEIGTVIGLEQANQGPGD